MIWILFIVILGNEALSDDDIFDPTVADVVDATYTMARALHDLQREKCPSSTQICTEMIASEGSELFQKITRQSFTSFFRSRSAYSL